MSLDGLDSTHLGEEATTLRILEHTTPKSVLLERGGVAENEERGASPRDGDVETAYAKREVRRDLIELNKTETHEHHSRIRYPCPPSLHERTTR